MKKMEKMIILDGIPIISKEDKEFIDSKNLSSDDMFRIFKIMVEQILGIKIIKWHYEPETCQTKIWFK